MAIITGIQICIPRTKADSVITKMESLLERRRTFQVTRRAFLITWGKLRVALRLTSEYQRLRDLIKARANSICEVCGRRGGEHMHHKDPVAFYPRRALDPTNVVWSCVVCHEDLDRESQQTVRRRLKRERLERRYRDDDCR